ncbi:hypothetical protein NIES37_56370 [Tolypothrix tenuis PCC 7101]|uniref:Uncharacterized protein n=1 Tax=Tolypothrix tenuis PCC 7101 TaxID=231146 RepID=A0A1Z4N7C1_9CYAN|nr:hypothetical protein NIES37_56370 [Tolypothrix tenuis PCC 7101]BAZ74441.1 hypothetical protein NIES50_30150 [Aulosira laxa NIES-50]
MAESEDDERLSQDEAIKYYKSLNNRHIQIIV